MDDPLGGLMRNLLFPRAFQKLPKEWPKNFSRSLKDAHSKMLKCVFKIYLASSLHMLLKDFP